ncbi:MAG: heme-binding protein [Burkholderiales bacterium]|nr:heme-binding protein [Burkholderiales bacterium]
MRSNRPVARAALAALLISPAALPAQPSASYTVRLMTPETALKAAQAALADCRGRNYQIAVAVVDRAGLLQVLLRDRFAGPHTVDMALNKAWTAVSFRTATTELGAQTQPGRPMSGIRDLPRVIAAGGGMPVEAGGSLWGAVGVSGGPNGEADDRCAKAGIDAVADELSF